MKNRPSNVGLVVELTRQADALTRDHPSAGLDYPKLVRRLAAAEIGIIWAAHNLGFRQATTAVGPEISRPGAHYRNLDHIDGAQLARIALPALAILGGPRRHLAGWPRQHVGFLRSDDRRGRGRRRARPAGRR